MSRSFLASFGGVLLGLVAGGGLMFGLVRATDDDPAVVASVPSVANAILSNTATPGTMPVVQTADGISIQEIYKRTSHSVVQIKTSSAVITKRNREIIRAGLDLTWLQSLKPIQPLDQS